MFTCHKLTEMKSLVDSKTFSWLTKTKTKMEYIFQNLTNPNSNSEALAHRLEKRTKPIASNQDSVTVYLSDCIKISVQRDSWIWRSPLATPCLLLLLFYLQSLNGLKPQKAWLVGGRQKPCPHPVCYYNLVLLLSNSLHKYMDIYTWESYQTISLLLKAPCNCHTTNSMQSLPYPTLPYHYHPK